MPVCASPRREASGCRELVCADIPSINLRSSLYPELNSAREHQVGALHNQVKCVLFEQQFLNGLRFGTAVLLRFNKC